MFALGAHPPISPVSAKLWGQVKLKLFYMAQPSLLV